MICTFLWGNDQVEKLSEIKSPLVTEGYVLLNIEWWRTYTSAKFVSVLPQSVAFSSWNPFVQKKRRPHGMNTFSWPLFFYHVTHWPIKISLQTLFLQTSVKVSWFRKDFLKFLFAPKNERKYICISALATKKRSNQKNKDILFWLSYTIFLIWPLFIG